MTMTPGPATWTSLNAQVAAEVRAEMGRRGMSNAELARLLGVSEAWTTRRLGKRAESPLSLVDLQRIAAALRVPLAVFFTAEIRDVIPQRELKHPYISAALPAERPRSEHVSPRPLGRSGRTDQTRPRSSAHRSTNRPPNTRPTVLPRAS